MKTKQLTLKQKAFCKAYIENNGNATEAYIIAYSSKNKNTARTNASKLLTNANISKEIKSLLYSN
jgi:phage terminase small subunit